MNKKVSSSKKQMITKKQGEEQSKNKKIAIISSIVAVVVCLVIAVSVICSVLLRKQKDKVFAIPALDLPIEERYALQKYKFEDVFDVMTTIRADTMVVTRRGLQRGETKPLSNSYTLSSKASITFKDYPSPSHGFSGESSALYLNEAKAMFPSDTDAVAVKKYSYYYKYMLLSQNYNEVIKLQDLSKELYNGSKADFERELYKHPNADNQYGAVVGTDNAVEKVITLDPLYRSYHVTGLYLPAGECVTVKVEGLGEGEQISMFIGLQDTLAWRGSAPNTGANTTHKDKFFFDADNTTAQGNFGDYFKFNEENELSGHNFIQSQWARQNGRLPYLSANFVFDKNGTYYIGTPCGGIMHINPGNCYSSVKTTITGAVETPHYIWGVTTPEYFDTYLRNAPGVVGAFDTENGQLVGPTFEAGTTGYIRQIKTDEIEKLSLLWHSFFSVNESFTGGTYNRFNIVKFDQHVPAGAAVALGNYNYACPTSWFNGAMNYRGLLSYGTWGILHEIGHNHASSYGTVWGFQGSMEGEVRNNALITLSYIMFCDIGTTIDSNGNIAAEHGFVAHPYSSLKSSLAINTAGKTDFNEYGYFEALSMYSNLMHSFGAEKFYELLYTYKANPSFIEVDTNTLSQDERNRIKRADFAYRCSVVYGMNFLKYYNTMYKANITNAMFTNKQLEYMNKLPVYEPVANLYAGGIDGVKTGGDYKVNFGSDIIFDLKAKTISTIPFEVISVNKPTHGSITKNDDGTYTYTFNSSYNGTSDEITFRVKLEDGLCHDFTIYLRITYDAQGGQLSIYNGITPQANNRIGSWDTIVEEMKNKIPRTEAVIGSVIPRYYTPAGEWEVRVLDYYWTAPKTGKIYLDAKCDDAARVYFGESFELLENHEFQYSNGHTTYNLSTITKDVVEGTKYCIRLLNVNTGGYGSASVGIRYEDESYKDVPKEQIWNPLYNESWTDFKEYIYEPEFIISKKDSIKVSTAGTDKSEWTILKAPDDDYLHNGRIDKITRVELEKDSEGNYTGKTVSYVVEIDKWDYLIDGDAGTMIHTKYGSGFKNYPTEQNPYEILIDTGKEQQFNYFAVTTRTGALAVSMITKYELQISSNGEDFTTIMQGDKLQYTRNVATLKFDSVSGRYLRLLIKGSTGNNGQFVVIAELDAGISSSTQKIIPATTSMLYTTAGWQNTTNIEEEQNGYMLATKKNQKLVFRFAGEYFSMYGAVGEGFGKADVKIDGKYVQTIDCNSQINDTRKLLLNYEGLENKVHTVEIITKSSGRVMINMFGMGYTAELINAPNIYLEKALTISLVVFIIMFVIAFALLMCLLFIPKFRKFMGNNRAISALDKAIENNKAKRKAKKEEKKKQQELDNHIKSNRDKSVKAEKETKASKTVKVEENKASEKQKVTQTKNSTTNKNVSSSAKTASKVTSVPAKNETAKPVSVKSTNAKQLAKTPDKSKSTEKSKVSDKAKPAEKSKQVTTNKSNATSAKKQTLTENKASASSTKKPVSAKKK